MPCPSSLPVEVQTETPLEGFQSGSPRDWGEGRGLSQPPAVQLRTSAAQGGSREPHYFGSNRNWQPARQPHGANRVGSWDPVRQALHPNVLKVFYTEYLAKSLLSNTTCVAK